MPKVSIVANFYKSGKYIPALLKSVFAQTFQDWELICIDDCSPENDSEIIKKVTAKYNNQDKVRLIRNAKNLGISQSKEVGIKAANGEYITFIDGDDWFPNDAIQNLYEAITRHDADVAIGNAYRHFNFCGIKRNRLIANKIKEGDWDRPLYKDEFYDKYFINFFGVNIFSVPYWSKMYRTKFIKELDFIYPDKNNTVAEDHKFSLKVHQRAEKVVFINCPVYYWRWGGITSFKSAPEWSSKRFLEISQDYYIERKQISDTEFPKGFNNLLIELKNIFRVAIISLANKDRRQHDVSETLSYIEKCLAHPAYDDLPKLLEINHKHRNSPVITFMIEKNAEGIYDECYKIYKSNWKKRLVRKIFGLFTFTN